MSGANPLFTGAARPVSSSRGCVFAGKGAVTVLWSRDESVPEILMLRTEDFMSWLGGDALWTENNSVCRGQEKRKHTHLGGAKRFRVAGTQGCKKEWYRKVVNERPFKAQQDT